MIFQSKGVNPAVGRTARSLLPVLGQKGISSSGKSFLTSGNGFMLDP